MRGGLSDVQYGFRRGKSTTDAVILLRDTALAAVDLYEMCVAVSLDIWNAFNSIDWGFMLEALAKWEMPSYMIKLFQSYFHERLAEVVCMDCPSGKMQVEVSCGVPQGSVVRPLLWNLTYDQVLRTQLPEGVSMIGFADDTLIVGSGKTSKGVEEAVNLALSLVAGKIQELGLTLAVEKTEAVMFKRTYKDRVPEITLGGADVKIGGCIKYLGVIVDENLRFKQHIKVAGDKAQRVLLSLSRLMPNIGCPKEPRRRLLVSVVHSVMLYGAPVWGETLNFSKVNVDVLMRVQRRAALRSICAYRQVSYEAANLIAAIPPIDLIAFERMAVYNAKKVGNLERADGQLNQIRSPRDVTIDKWVRRLQVAGKGLWTRRLITDVTGWCKRRHGHLSYHLTQILSGHGCFGSYLERIGKETSSRCHHCTAGEDDAMHTIFVCPCLTEERNVADDILQGLDPDSMVGKMVNNVDCWNVIEKFVVHVMKAKEDAERARRPN